jgi:branched-chain amino acid transport system permease protein
MKRALWIGLFAVAAVLPLLVDPRGYWIRVLTLTLLFAAMAQAWNIVGGLANQISLGHAAFFGVGAYASTMLLVTSGLTPWIGLVVGAGLAAVAALVIAVPTMRLQGHYFALATLAFGEVMRVVANTWASLTGGPVGISVPFLPQDPLMYSFKTGLPHAYIALGALALVTLLFEGLRRSALGYRLRAIREHEPAAEVIGIDTTRVKLIATVISAAAMGALGTLYAQLALFFDPDTIFGVAPISIRVALIAIVGGIGTAVGPVLGALLVIPVEELANDLLSGRAPGLSQLVYGVLLILVILWRPRGLVTLFTARRTRKARAPAPAPDTRLTTT